MTSESCPGCGTAFPALEWVSSVGANARRFNAMPSLSHAGAIYYLCITCAQRACQLAREIVALHGGDKNVYLYTLATSDPVDGDPLRKLPKEKE